MEKYVCNENDPMINYLNIWNLFISHDDCNFLKVYTLDVKLNNILYTTGNIYSRGQQVIISMSDKVRFKLLLSLPTNPYQPNFTALKLLDH